MRYFWMLAFVPAYFNSYSNLAYASQGVRWKISAVTVVTQVSLPLPRRCRTTLGWLFGGENADRSRTLFLENCGYCVSIAFGVQVNDIDLRNDHISGRSTTRHAEAAQPHKAVDVGLQ